MHKKEKHYNSFLGAERKKKQWISLPLVGKSGYAEKPHVCRLGGLLFIPSQVILDAVRSSMSFVLVKLFVW